MNRPKIVVIVGPTASGKSSLAVKLAQKIGGEIISADSRQVYKKLDIGTGKITKKEMARIPHHMLDVASPNKIFTVSEFKRLAERSINKILKMGKVPIIAGGTGLYVHSIVDNIDFPKVRPNKKLRKSLNKKTLAELGVILKKLDPKRFRAIDKNNPRRLVRAIEIAKTIGKVPRVVKKPSPYKFYQIGIKPDKKTLNKNIRQRFLARIKSGMINEVRKLHANGLSWKRMEELGLEYKYLAFYLLGKLGKKEMEEKLKKEIERYAKRQMTWFKKDKRITWFLPSDKSNIYKAVKKFLASKG